MLSFKPGLKLSLLLFTARPSLKLIQKYICYALEVDVTFHHVHMLTVTLHDLLSLLEVYR